MQKSMTSGQPSGAKRQSSIAEPGRETIKADRGQGRVAGLVADAHSPPRHQLAKSCNPAVTDPAVICNPLRGLARLYF